ncbi:hypothetical protein J7L05_11875 [bacterium]|nr:hypothetical protein [bacterium]
MIKFNLSPHACNVCVINCIDFRIYKENTLHEFLHEEGVSSYDLVSVPGAGKAIIDETSRKLVVDSIRISMELHESKAVYIIHHRDCGAYGGSSASESPESEFEMHKSEMEKAEMILKAEFGSGLNVRKVFLDSSGGENPELRTVYPG